jgi:hypothetical protein
VTLFFFLVGESLVGMERKRGSGLWTIEVPDGIFCAAERATGGLITYLRTVPAAGRDHSPIEAKSSRKKGRGKDTGQGHGNKARERR